MAAILDLLAGGLSASEIEHGGKELLACKVEVTPLGGATETVPVYAADTVDAINKAMEILYPDWDQEKPKSGMKVRVVVFGRAAHVVL